MSDSSGDIHEDASYKGVRTPDKPRLILKPPKSPGPARMNKAYVAPPRLPSFQKQQYKPANEFYLALDLETRVDEIIGEYTEGKKLYYFARHDGGIAHKFLASVFTEKRKHLVEDYERKKAKGALQPFDPSATYVHPLSRVKVKININTRRVSGEDANVTPDSEEDEEDSESTGDGGDDDYEGVGVRRLPRRTTRPNTRKELPYSPRKSRARKVLTIVESDTENSEYRAGSPAPARRSTRTKRATEIHVIDSDDDDYLDDNDYNGPTKLKVRTKKRNTHIKSAPPMYGHFRDITTLDEDPFSDDEDNEALRRHRAICEKCHLGPADKLLAAFKKKSKSKGKKRKRSTEEFEESDNEDKYISMGGWVQCLKCPVSAHWKCLASTQRDEVLRAVRENDQKDWEVSKSAGDSFLAAPKKRSELSIEQTTEFICGACLRGGICMGCMETALEPDPSRFKKDETPNPNQHLNNTDDSLMKDGTTREPVHSLARELLFRCFTCKRLAHYCHLPTPPSFDDEPSIPEVAEHYQQSKSWLCADCSSFKYGLDKILAWRPYPPDALEPGLTTTTVANYKTPLPREYLVKWTGRSYRRVEWVPHMWLVSTNQAKLKNFISGGTKVDLLKKPAEPEAADMEVDDVVPINPLEQKSDSRGSSVQAEFSALGALPDAEQRIPPTWKTADRVLDVLLWRPTPKKGISHRKRKKVITVSSEEEPDQEAVDARNRAVAILERGEEPPGDLTETLEEWLSHDDLKKTDIDQVVWAFIKWNDLGYDETTWDTPPKPAETGYEAFRVAFERFIDSQTVFLPKRDKAFWKVFDNRPKGDYRKHLLKDASDLNLGQPANLKLMPFQVDGFNWLCSNWWDHQHCILADEMGLGKTVQIVTFLGKIIAKWDAFPALVVVPNSTVTNWVREFERWAPRLRVVSFHGEKTSRDIIKQFELYHKSPPPGTTNVKFHVLVTTYESLTGAKDFTPVFKNMPRWEALIVDEGQRLKSDSSLLFRKLNELNSAHRIIMTGTPLNNNMRELFNLMNFLDPEEWKDLEALEKQHEELDEDLVKQLHTRLRPYFLRRIKSEVLELPPKNEVIIPVSMAPLQREVYRSILSHNFNLLGNLTQPTKGQSAPTKGRINNVLMQLRKCLQHPYLYSEDIEPQNLPPQESHGKLIDASAKLRFLKSLLPKLKERGHRVLLFSQFVIALNVIEDFLQGEGYKFLRLDGSTKGSIRQKAMDEFNKPGSEYFIFLLTTRAGGVGINLFTADTVIIFDPDFNPHQDLQAIARAYRYGQQKTCLVFKLMVKDSAEERIIQIGKKKLVLDHLIVQKMDDDDENGGEDVQSILTYGAQALFDSENTRDITYSDNDIDKLLDKTEKEAVREAPKAAGGLSFAFAKIWAADKDSLEEVVEEDQTDSWAQTLQNINSEREKEQEKYMAESGRGARRKAADIAKTKIHVGAGGSDIFDKPTKQRRQQSPKDSRGSDGSAYSGSEESIDSDSDHGAAIDEDFTANVGGARSQSKILQPTNGHPLNPIQNTGQHYVGPDCGLCGQRHESGQCLMVDRSENLAEYREMLILHADDEPWEERSAAVQAIDEILHRRGHLSLIAGQPLHPLPKSNIAPSPSKKVKRPSHANDPMTSSSQNQPLSVPRQNTSSSKAELQRAESSKQASSSHASQSVVYTEHPPME